MKILLATLEYPPQVGGVANYYANLKDAWPEPENFIIIDNSTHLLLARRRYFPWLKAIRSINKAYKQNQIDITFIGQILPLGTVAWILSLFSKFKFGVFFHGLDYSLATKNSFKKNLTKLILERAKIIVCANSEVNRLLLEFCPQFKNKTEIINPGVKKVSIDLLSRDNLDSKYNIKDKKIIFSLGRLVRRKGFDRVIQSLDSLDRDDFVYVVCGEGEEKKYLQDLALKSSYNKNILFIDHISEAEKWSWLALCDIFIMPSRNVNGDFEGFGIVYLEANLMGSPVIAGNSGGVRDAVVNNYNGLLVNPEDNNEIAAAINKLLTNPDFAKKLGQQGRERALKEFNWPNLAKKLFNKLKALS